MTKLNPTTMKTQYDGQYDTFCRKNHDYGNSFEESLDQFGIIASLVRMQDKMLRLQSLTDESKTQQVGSESLLDTLEDLSNYAAMTACWLKGIQAEDDVINKSYHQVKDLIEAGEEVVREEHDYSDIVDIFRYNMQAAKDTMKFWRKPGTPFTPLGPEIVHEPQLPEELYNYIKENMDDCVNRIYQLQARGELPTIGGIEHYTYNIGRCAIDHYEDPYKIVEYVKDMPSLRSLDDKHARLVIDSIKNYITDFNKEKEASKLTDEAYDFLEEQVTRAVEYIAHIRAHGRAPQNKDIGDYAYDIARYALEQYPDPYRIIQHMGQILAMRSLNPNDALLFCSRVTDYIRNMNAKEKGSNMAKAMDTARQNVIAIGARGAGKGFAKTRSLMEELGVPKETIKEIFEDMEDEDDE